MKRVRLERVLAPLSLAIVWLALLWATLLLFTPAQAAASFHPGAPPPPELITLLPVKPPAGDTATSLQATPVPSISNIIGATYDEDRGEVIIFGIADPDLPPLDFPYISDNLVIALRAFYNRNNPDPIPGVSIEGTLDPLDVLYFGTLTNTHFGQVAFEADRLLKIYNLGMDNLTDMTVTSSVTGYMSYPDRMRLLTETITDPILTRYFFTPTLLIAPIPTPHTIIFSQTQKLIDWAYLSAITSPATTEAAQGFVDNFNQYYADYAAERLVTNDDTTLYEIVQLSKLTAIAQWMQDEGLEAQLPGINHPWLSHYPVAYAATVTQTPGITVTWIQTTSGSTYISSLRGGVYAVGDTIEIPFTEADQELADDIYDGFQPILPPPMKYIARSYKPHPLGPFETQGPVVAYVIPLADNAVINGDFEDGPGSQPWEQDSLFEIISSDSPHNGSYSAWFAGYDNAQDAISQTLYLPADATMARLTYWRAVATGESTHPHDFFTSFLANNNGTPLTILEALDDGDADGFWHEVSFDISIYAGQTVQLWFTATTNGSAPTSFFVDDVSLDYLDLTPPIVISVTHTPANVLVTSTVEFAVVFHEPMKTSIPPTVTIHPPDSQTSYSLIPKTGISYTNGYLNSDPIHWYGTYTFTGQMDEGPYMLDISTAQDIAGNVMYPAQNVHSFILKADPPQIQSTFPANGASKVPVNASIVISFSEVISTNTFTYTVLPDPGGWLESWNSTDKVVTLTHNDFALAQTYTATVTEAKDLVGNSLNGAPFTWSFTTTVLDTVLPQVQSTFPANGASEVPVNATIVISFSEVISTSTFTYTVLPDPGGWLESWNNTNKIVTLTHNDFALGQTYTATITEAKDLANNSLKGAPFTWSFTTAQISTSYKIYLPLTLKTDDP